MTSSPRSVSPHAMPGPDTITRVALDNGLVVLVRENHAAPVVVVDGYLRTGSVYEPEDQAGLASFAADMLTHGSAHYDFDHFNETVESVGASLSVGADDHTTAFGTTSLSEDFPTMLGVLADVLRRPTFPAEHVNRVRAQKLVYIQERDEDPAQVAMQNFYAAVYPNHPYGRATGGYRETVSAIQIADLADFHARTYTPQGAIVVVVGDVQTEAALELVRAQFGDWQGAASAPTLPPAVPLNSIHREARLLHDKSQADIVLGCSAIPRHHPDYYAVRVANTILGRFGMMGRLGERVREEQGLAYYAYSTQDAGEAAGVWLAAAGVNPANLGQAIGSILTEFTRLREEPVPAEELADSQAYMTGVLPLTLETNEGVASTLLNMEYFGLGLDYLLRYEELIHSVTAADVQRVAQTYLRPDAYALVIAGPVESHAA